MERSLSDTFKKIDEKKLLLPDFQRDYKWGVAKQQSLLASILLKFPVGSSLILEGQSDDFALRKIGETIQHTLNESEKCEYLLDGQQRTTTLYNAFNDVYDFSQFTNQDELSEFISRKANPMKVRWFIRVPVCGKANENVTDIFNATTVLFDKEEIDHFEPNDIVDIFSCECFNEKKNKGITKWFSPYYQLKSFDDEKTKPQIITQFVNDCIDNGMIPMFMIGTKPIVINRILEGIADINMQAIRDKYENNFNFIKENYDIAQIFDGLNNIKDVEENDMSYTDELERIFITCKNEWKNNVSNYLVRDIFDDYQLNSLVTNDIRRAIPIFCHLNDGGMKLDDFDLVSAKLAKKVIGDTETYSLSSLIRAMFVKPVKLSSYLSNTCDANSLYLNEMHNLSDGLPSGYFSKAILAICTVLARREIEESQGNIFEVKKKDTSSKTLLGLETEIIRKYIIKATLAVQRAYAFLLIRCGVYNSNKLHYSLMIEPIAYIFSEDNYWEDHTAHKKIEYWYWTSVFSGRYIYDQSAIVIDDINQLYNWVNNNVGDKILSREELIFKDDKYASKKLLMQELDEFPKDNIRYLILQYVLSITPSYDLLAKETNKLNAYRKNEQGDIVLWPANASDGLNDHHIIPLGSVTTLGQSTAEIRQDPHYLLNSPLNRVLISGTANNLISSMDPSRYFKEIPQNKIVMKSLLIGNSFSNISTGSTKMEIYQSLSERFDALEQSVKEHLLHLRVDI
ncbi:GmrSD restriction endonuclease domain-containing protein [Photobacterium damselae]|uniref:GmrSD restriction endonuclease domain-containing protein n=1 Tax=Photobacterium damselae TaxID=38293 RepID=UPI0040691E4B